MTDGRDEFIDVVCDLVKKRKLRPLTAGAVIEAWDRTHEPPLTNVAREGFRKIACADGEKP